MSIKKAPELVGLVVDGLEEVYAAVNEFTLLVHVDVTTLVVSVSLSSSVKNILWGLDVLFCAMVLVFINCYRYGGFGTCVQPFNSCCCYNIRIGTEES